MQLGWAPQAGQSPGKGHATASSSKSPDQTPAEAQATASSSKHPDPHAEEATLHEQIHAELKNLHSIDGKVTELAAKADRDNEQRHQEQLRHLERAHEKEKGELRKLLLHTYDSRARMSVELARLEQEQSETRRKLHEEREHDKVRHAEELEKVNNQLHWLEKELRAQDSALMKYKRESIAAYQNELDLLTEEQADILEAAETIITALKGKEPDSIQGIAAKMKQHTETRRDERKHEMASLNRRINALVEVRDYLRECAGKIDKVCTSLELKGYACLIDSKKVAILKNNIQSVRDYANAAIPGAKTWTDEQIAAWEQRKGAMIYNSPGCDVCHKHIEERNHARLLLDDERERFKQAHEQVERLRAENKQLDDLRQRLIEEIKKLKQAHVEAVQAREREDDLRLIMGRTHSGSHSKEKRTQ